MNYQALEKALFNLPKDALENIVGSVFMPPFFEALGFSSTEIYLKYKTGKGACTVDYALRHNQEGIETFLKKPTNPQILVEIKKRSDNLLEGTSAYKHAFEQLKSYLLDSNCQSVQWGIITNSSHIQLFRKQGKVIYPATLCEEINTQNISEIVNKIKQKINNTPRGLTVAVYNNKGGVGKTTTTVNLAAVLAVHGKKVLVVDFDPNQRDLTNSFNFQHKKKSLFDLLEDKNNVVSLNDVVMTYAVRFSNPAKILNFDIIPCDDKLADSPETDLGQLFKLNRLRQVLYKAKFYYDYILIDSPPNWRFFSRSAVTASDVVLIPTKPNNIFSLDNAAITIAKFIPEIRGLKKDGSPIALPIFWNGEKITPAQEKAAYQAIDDIIEKYKKNIETKLNLEPYFYPHNNHHKKIFEVPYYAHIANAAFSRIPAVYRNQTAYSYYSELAKEYFLQ